LLGCRRTIAGGDDRAGPEPGRRSLAILERAGLIRLARNVVNYKMSVNKQASPEMAKPLVCLKILSSGDGGRPRKRANAGQKTLLSRR
jgi:hypothetical protein